MRPQRLYFFVSVLALFQFVNTSAARGAETWDFKSKYDDFKVLKESSAIYLDGKLVEGSRWIEELQPTMQLAAGEACPALPAKADLQVKWTRGTNEITRYFYLDKKVASTGKGECINLTGLGIYFAPYHKLWCTGSPNYSIDTSKGFTLSGDAFSVEVPVKDSSRPLNWSRVRDFQKLMAEIRIEGRAHTAILNDIGRESKTFLTLKTAGKTFKFHRIQKDQWLMEAPNVAWLVLSPHFGFFEGLTEAAWLSPFAGKLKQIADKEHPRAERISIIGSLNGETSQDIRQVFQNILWNNSEDDAVKSAVVAVLRSSPSDENMLTLAQALLKTDDQDLMVQIISVLKIRNPKGPQIETGSDVDEIKPAIQSWQAWAKQFEKSI